MEELTCDECGTINDADRVVCELCGDPLGEERRDEQAARQQRSLFVLVPLALLASAISYGFGVGIAMFVACGSLGEARDRGRAIGDVSLSTVFDWMLSPGFLLVYTVVWLSLVVFAPRLGPDRRDEPRGGYNDLFSYMTMSRREKRAKFGGCLLLPFESVHYLWSKVFEQWNRSD